MRNDIIVNDIYLEHFWYWRHLAATFYHSSEDGGSAVGAGDSGSVGSAVGAGDGASVSLACTNPNFLMSTLAIIWLALSDGWYSSQNTYLLLSLHNVDAGIHVRAGRMLPNEQQGESELLNPENIERLEKSRIWYPRKQRRLKVSLFIVVVNRNEL